MEIIVILRFGEFYLSPSSNEAGHFFAFRQENATSRSPAGVQGISINTILQRFLPLILAASAWRQVFSLLLALPCAF
jgi:hypothetical protein